MNPDQRKFAVFDIDGTLIRWQLFHAIFDRLGNSGFITPEHHNTIKEARMHWKNRETNEGFTAYEKVLIGVYLDVLQTIDPDDHRHVIEDVVNEYQDQTFTYTRDLVRRLRGEGYLLFAVSGSHNEAVAAVARHHGFDDSIGASFETKNGQFTGEVATPIYDKKAALDTLVRAHDATYEDSYAVGDSMSDASMLAAVTHPIAFNPDQLLYDEAKKQGWPIVVERKNVVYELAQKDGTYELHPGSR